MTYDYAITFACYNSVHYTKTLVNSLLRVGTPLERVVVVDNGSTDATRDYLLTLNLGGRIYNKSNQACGVAWNQGILHLQAEWSVVMNNDVIVPPQWIEKMIQTAIDHNLKVISPALMEGELDYDFDAFSAASGKAMKDAFRHQTQHEVCIGIHRSVFQDIGYFRANPKLLGFEDTIFFHELAKSPFLRAINGAVWLHHFGSITQNEMKQSMGKSEKEVLVEVNDRQLLQQGWLERKLAKMRAKKQSRAWREAELQQYGMTLHGERVDHHSVWR
jgi:GT2 family glycosyltransferase